MNTLTAHKIDQQVRAVDVSIDDTILGIRLSDGRELRIPYPKIPWLEFLVSATSAQRKNWSLEPGGYAVYWEDMDDGVEVSHLLTIQPLT
ncbi:MAG: DUF2442 domain-containing protein [Caldilineaceae bacterium]|nr:DUF2442 domain-containing protein [Caldilineaceae bacterium]MCB9159231.1 DUF2442 domain-containing protein [Caldilineaceae bacterium]